MTFWRFFTTRYTDYLEAQVAELKSQLALERQEVRRLTEQLVPGLRVSPYEVAAKANSVTSSPDVRKSAHQITKADDQQSAKCTCGWQVANCGDLVKLQTEIAEHYKLSFPPIKAKRPSPSELIRVQEAQSLEEFQNQRRA